MYIESLSLSLSLSLARARARMFPILNSTLYSPHPADTAATLILHNGTFLSRFK